MTPLLFFIWFYWFELDTFFKLFYRPYIWSFMIFLAYSLNYWFILFTLRSIGLKLYLKNLGPKIKAKTVRDLITVSYISRLKKRKIGYPLILCKLMSPKKHLMTTSPKIYWRALLTLNLTYLQIAWRVFRYLFNPINLILKIVLANTEHIYLLITGIGVAWLYLSLK